LNEAMALSASRKKRRPLTWRDYRTLQIVLLCAVLIGPAMVGYGLYADRRDRPSLQWPTAVGVVTQCRAINHNGNGKYSYYNVAINYTYVVDGRPYVGTRVALWNSDWQSGGKPTLAFVAAHPAGSAVDVFYDPLERGNAVLIPGADEAGNWNLIRGGGIGFVFLVVLALRMRTQLASMKVALQSADARRRAAGPAKAAGLPHGFASYEPDCKRKLNAFPDRECLMEVLGHQGKPLQEWKAEDRVIDASGREYRLVKPAGKNRYDLDPTGQTWSYERLLEVAQADIRVLKKDPEALRRQLDDVPADEKLAVILKGIDDQPMGPRLVMAGFILFLVLFFLAVLFGAGEIVNWLLK
jgi:hypothetical protein